MIDITLPQVEIEQTVYTLDFGTIDIQVPMSVN